MSYVTDKLSKMSFVLTFLFKQKIVFQVEKFRYFDWTEQMAKFLQGTNINIEKKETKANS